MSPTSPYRTFCPVCLYDGRRPWACTQTRCPIHDMFNERRRQRTAIHAALERQLRALEAEA